MSTDRKTPEQPPPAPEPPPQPHAAPRPKRRDWLWWVQRLFVAGLTLGVGLTLIVCLGLAQKIGWITAGAAGEAADADSTADTNPAATPEHEGRRFVAPRVGRRPAADGDTADADPAADENTEEDA